MKNVGTPPIGYPSERNEDTFSKRPEIRYCYLVKIIMQQKKKIIFFL